MSLINNCYESKCDKLIIEVKYKSTNLEIT